VKYLIICYTLTPRPLVSFRRVQFVRPNCSRYSSETRGGVYTVQTIAPIYFHCVCVYIYIYISTTGSLRRYFGSLLSHGDLGGENDKRDECQSGSGLLITRTRRTWVQFIIYIIYIGCSITHVR